MATRKKKETLDMPGTMGGAKIVLPKDIKGSHLTVTTFPDGKTELVWDDEALLRDVQNALTDYENTVKLTVTETKAKKTKK